MQPFPVLQHLFQTGEPVAIVPASASLLREIGLRAAIERRVLALVTGEESAALADTAEALGAEVVRLMAHPGEAVEAEVLERWLHEPAIDSVALVHSEPSTGVLTPLDQIAEVVQRHPELVLFVDATGTLAAAPVLTDVWGLDFVLGSSDGPLGLAPGLALATASPRLLSRTRGLTGRGVLLDYLTHHTASAEGTLLFDLPQDVADALGTRLEALTGGGLERHWEAHRAAAASLEAWVAGRNDVSLVARRGRRSPVASCLRLASPSAVTRVTDRLSSQGWPVGLSVLEGSLVLQVEHVGGDVQERIPFLLNALEAALAGD